MCQISLFHFLDVDITGDIAFSRYFIFLILILQENEEILSTPYGPGDISMQERYCI